MRATHGTAYTHKECGAPVRWGADGGVCLGAQCGATALKILDLDTVAIPLPRTAPVKHYPGEVALFGVEEVKEAE